MTTETRNPYVGPRTFEREDAPYFFGREREAQDLLFLVLSQRLVLFYAQSGAGKSSLLNTRLRPGLEAEGFRVLPTGRVSGQLPKGIQAQAVSNIFAFNLLLALDGGRVPAAQLQRTPLLDYLRQYQPTPDDRTPTVLLIDQFEEILTTHQDRWMEREGFFQQLQTAMAQDSRLWVVLTLREDYVAALDPYARLLPGRLRSRYYMQRMNAAAALEAITNPAQKEGRPFGPGVGQQLVDNLRQLGNEQGEGKEPGFAARSGFLAGLGEFVEPLQLQVVCQRLWANLANRPGNIITAEDLSELGDVNTALADFYEQTLRQTTLETGVDEYVLRPWVDEALITEGGTRGTVARGQNSSGGLPNDALDSLTRQFLLRQEPRAGGIWYELIHDRFLEPIQQSNQRWRAAQGDLYQTALNWKRTGRPREKLYQGNLLWEGLSQKNWGSLPLVVQEFLTASLDVQSETDLADFYEQALQQASLEAGIDEYVLRPWIDEKLITVEGVRGLVARGQTNTEGLPNAAVDSLMRQFLLRQEPRAGVFWYELIHDRFVEPIRQANRRWREAQSPLSGPLHQTALQWDRSGRSEKLLYQGDLLYESLRQENLGDATPVVQAFLTASQEAQARRDEERERETRTNRRLRWLTVALVGAVLVAAVLAVLAFGESNRATAEAQDAATARVNAENNAQEALTQEAQAIVAQATAEASQ